MSTPLPLRVVAFSPARLYGVPFSTAARSTSSGVALYWTRAASAVLGKTDGPAGPRSEEHTSELQSRLHLVCRLLLEKKKRAATTLNWAPPTCPFLIRRQ